MIYTIWVLLFVRTFLLLGLYIKGYNFLEILIGIMIMKFKKHSLEYEEYFSNNIISFALMFIRLTDAGIA